MAIASYVTEKVIKDVIDVVMMFYTKMLSPLRCRFSHAAMFMMSITLRRFTHTFTFTAVMSMAMPMRYAMKHHCRAMER